MKFSVGDRVAIYQRVQRFTSGDLDRNTGTVKNIWCDGTIAVLLDRPDYMGHKEMDYAPQQCRRLKPKKWKFTAPSPGSGVYKVESTYYDGKTEKTTKKVVKTVEAWANVDDKGDFYVYRFCNLASVAADQYQHKIRCIPLRGTYEVEE